MKATDTFDPTQTPYFVPYFACLVAGSLGAGYGVAARANSARGTAAAVSIGSAGRLPLRILTAAFFLWMLHRSFFTSKNAICDEVTGQCVTLAGERIFSTFTVQNWTALTILFSVEALSDILSVLAPAPLAHMGQRLNSSLAVVHNVLATWAVMITALCAAICVALLVADGSSEFIQQRRRIFFGSRGMIMHNANAVGALISHFAGKRQFKADHFAYILLWGLWYGFFSLWWYHQHGIFYYTFISPHKVVCVPGVFGILAGIYAVTQGLAA